MNKNPDIIVHCEIVEGSTGGRVYGKTYKIQLELQNRLNKIKEYLKQVHYETKHGILSSNDLIYENIERLCDGKDLIKESKND